MDNLIKKEDKNASGSTESKTTAQTATNPLAMNKTNSISNFLGGASPANQFNRTFHQLSLVSPAYEQPKAPSGLPQFSNPLEMRKTPSLIKEESKSETGILRQTPVYLPQDTPAGTVKKETPDGMGSLATPAGSKTKDGFNMPSKPASQNLSGYVKTLEESGMNLQQLQNQTIVQTQNVRRPQEEPTLQNIVSTVDLKCRLDLKTIALNARNTEYNPKRFAAAIMKIRHPKTTALIFSSGKMVCTGAKSEEESKKAAKKYAKTIKNMGFEVKFTDFKVQNIVASADVGFAIRLESLSHRHAEFCQYEPEIFPGLIYRIYSPKVVVLIFVSGKIVLTGAKTREQIKEAYSNILPALQMHKKEESNIVSRS